MTSGANVTDVRVFAPKKNISRIYGDCVILFHPPDNRFGRVCRIQSDLMNVFIDHVCLFVLSSNSLVITTTSKQVK